MAIEENKALLISRRYTMQCDICLLLDVEAKNKKFWLWEEGTTTDEDSYICDDCMQDILKVKKLCHQKIDNPHHDVFKDFVPTFVKEIPGLKEVFAKELV